MNKVKYPSQALKSRAEIDAAIKNGASEIGGGLEVTADTTGIIEGKIEGILYTGLREDQQRYAIVSSFVLGDFTDNTGKIVSNARADISTKMRESVTNDDVFKAYCTAQPYTKKGDEKTYYKLVVNSLDANVVTAKSEAFITEAIPAN